MGKNIKKKKIIEKLFQNYWRYNVFITLKKSTNLLFLDCEIFRSRNCVSFLFVFSLVLYTSSVQLLSSVQLFANPWTAAHQASLSITNSWSLLKLMSIELVMPFNHLILCHPLLLLPSIFPGIRVFSNESVLRIRWPEYWSFSFSISPSNEHSGLITSRSDWFDFLAVQGTLKSPLQLHSSKASILWRSAFFMVQLAYLSEKAMAPHSSTLAWKIPWMEEPGGLQSLGR